MRFIRLMQTISKTAPKVNMAAVAPIPSARMSAAKIENPGVRLRERKAKRRGAGMITVFGPGRDVSTIQNPLRSEYILERRTILAFRRLFTMQVRVLAFVLAGGKGTRLYPLTKERAKPAVPFGGRYRIVDFVLSNLVNSGIYSTYVLIQFKSQCLLQHLREGWEVSGLLQAALHHSRAGADAIARRGLVSRHRRRDLSEHQPDRAGRSALRGVSSAPITSTA